MSLEHAVFLKVFDEKRFADSFMSGQMRMMSMYHYKNYKEIATCTSGVRNDPFQNCVMVEPDENGDVDLHGIKGKMWIEPNGFMKAGLSHADLDKRTKIFSLFILEKDKIIDGLLSSVISSDMISFGNYCCMIQAEELCRRVDQALKTSHVIRQFYGKEVTYDNTHKGYQGPFIKLNDQDWQNEYRFVAYTDCDDPFIVDIGNIEDITRLVDTAQLKNAHVEVRDGKDYFTPLNIIG